MVIKKTILNPVRVTPAGHLQVQLRLETDNSFEYRRTTITVGDNVDQVIAANLNAGLVREGFPVVSVEDIQRIKARSQVEWTPAVVAEWNTRPRVV